MNPPVIAVDFGGTLARPDRGPTTATVASLLRRMPGSRIPDWYADALTEAMRVAKERDRPTAGQTSFVDLLTAAAAECGAFIRDPMAAADEVMGSVPDGVVFPDAAEALRALRRAGVRLVLACDTRRPEAVRRRTLQEAGVEDSFDALVLSSTLGVHKPHTRFYAAVAAAVDCRPGDVVFVGDTPSKDVSAPIAFGMEAVLVVASRPAGLDPRADVITRFADLPAAYLKEKPWPWP